MTKLAGAIVDAETGDTVQARVQILNPGGQQVAPSNALWKEGPGEPFFYSDGEFSVDVDQGFHQVLVERGTEYRPWRGTIVTHSTGIETVDIALERWTDLPDRGWHPGNTHLHYSEKETRPDERLRFDSRVEDLRMTAVSILKRWDQEYATNKYPIGILNEFTDTHHVVQCGEETRHNMEPWVYGYGHVMLLNIRNAVAPLSRGLLVDAFDPDYPPLIYACDDAARQGGIVIWCHNGEGMEAPVAAALGKVDAMNLFDPYWRKNIEYSHWYRMLNCGIRLAASTGSDWFVSSANRVYSDTEGTFDYDKWLQSLREGHTFITNGPALFLSVEGRPPGAELNVDPGARLSVQVSWHSHYAVERVEVVAAGKVVERRDFPDGSTRGEFECEVQLEADGWVAARLASTTRDSFAQPQWAHTSPVYVDAGGGVSEERSTSAAWFVSNINESLAWVNTKGRFYTDAQRKEVVDIFKQGREVYIRLAP